MIAITLLKIGFLDGLTHNCITMKAIAFLADLIVLGGLVFGMIVLLGDTYTHGGIITKALIMGGVGGIYGLLRALYRKWLIPEMGEKEA